MGYIIKLFPIWIIKILNLPPAHVNIQTSKLFFSSYKLTIDD